MVATITIASLPPQFNTIKPVIQIRSTTTDHTLCFSSTTYQPHTTSLLLQNPFSQAQDSSQPMESKTGEQTTTW
jgi:hypothetical protein